MTRRRDLFKQIAGFSVCIGLFLIIFHWILEVPLTHKDWKQTFAFIGIEILLIGVSSFYVWRANIKTPKKTPDYLIDFPDSAVYLLCFPIFAIFLIILPFFSQLSSVGEQILFIFSCLFLFSSLLFVATIIVDGFTLFLSSKYSQVKKRKQKNSESVVQEDSKENLHV